MVYGRRGIFDNNQGLATTSTVPPVIALVKQIPAATAMCISPMLNVWSHHGVHRINLIKLIDQRMPHSSGKSFEVSH